MKQLHQSQQNEKHYNYQVPESGTRLFLYLIKSKLDTSYTRTYLLMRKQCLMIMLMLAASTAVTQELYLDEKAMPHLYVIITRIYSSYTGVIS